MLKNFDKYSIIFLIILGNSRPLLSMEEKDQTNFKGFLLSHEKNIGPGYIEGYYDTMVSTKDGPSEVRSAAFKLILLNKHSGDQITEIVEGLHAHLFNLTLIRPNNVSTIQLFEVIKQFKCKEEDSRYVIKAYDKKAAFDF